MLLHTYWTMHEGGTPEALLVETEFDRDENRGEWWAGQVAALREAYPAGTVFATLSIKVDQETVRRAIVDDDAPSDISDADSLDVEVLFIQRKERYPREWAPEALGAITTDLLLDSQEEFWKAEVERSLGKVSDDIVGHKVLTVAVPRELLVSMLSYRGPVVTGRLS